MNRAWQLALVVASSVLAIVVASAIVREARAPWRRQQAVLRSRGVEVPAGVVEVRTSAGVERCLTCHFDLATGATALHSLDLSQHPPFVVGCVGCHGGDGRALDQERAHTAQGRYRLEDKLWRQSRCSLCHVPGSVDDPGKSPKGDDGGAVARGLLLYEELGCMTCHRTAGMTQAADRQGGYGPDLDDSGRFEPATMLRLLRDPLAYFGPTTKMPPFGPLLDLRPEIAAPLVAYLLTLRRDLQRPLALGDASQACAGCHAATPPRGLERHRCTYINLRRDELRCQRCHQVPATQPSSAPALSPAAIDCLYVDRLRSACGACHRIEARGGGVAHAD